MKTLTLAKDLPLPLAAVTEKLAWLGRTGSGKTYGALKLAELMLAAGAQVGAIDPVGVWRSLRVPTEKGGTSFDVVVFGGLYGDLPLDAGAGELVADLVVDRGLSFVLDVSQLIPSEQQRFVRAFADRFFHRKKAAPSAVHLFMEECQEFIPENPSGLEAQTLGVMQRLWKLGRNFGIGGSLISQRPQEIAKKALNMSGTLFAFQMTGPQERKAIRAWVADHGVATDIEAVLQKLRTGEPHVESPTFLSVSKTVRILPRVTADLSSTPEVGAAATARKPLTPIDVEQLKASMAATIEKAKADDPKWLKSQLAHASDQLAATTEKLNALQASSSTGSGLSVSGEGKKTEVLTDADRELLGKVRTWLDDHRAFVTSLGDGIRDRLMAAIEEAVDDAAKRHAILSERARDGFVEHFEKKGLTRILEKLDHVSLTPASSLETSVMRSMRTLTAPGPGHRSHLVPTVTVSPSRNPGLVAPGPTRDAVVKMARHVAAADGAVPPVQQRILDALAELELLGAAQPPRELVAFMAGYTHLQSKGFVNAMSALSTAGCVIYGQGTVALTPDGHLRANRPAAPRSARELQDRVIAMLGGASGRILEPLIEAYPHGMARADVAARAGYGHLQSKGFVNAISRLRTLGFVDYPDRGSIIAKPVLFLGAAQ